MRNSLTELVCNIHRRHNWLDEMESCTNRARYEVCSDEDDFRTPLYIRATQWHRFLLQVEPAYVLPIQISEIWMQEIYHTGNKRDKANVLRSG